MISEFSESMRRGNTFAKAEQGQIDAFGGPTNKSNPDGKLQNKRNEIAKPRSNKKGW
jgi:hypothetical protein